MNPPNAKRRRRRLRARENEERARAGGVERRVLEAAVRRARTLALVR